MAKLLIISYLFAPDRKIGAIRWSKLAKYLTRAGHDIDVIASAEECPVDDLLKRDIGEMGKITRISHWCPPRRPQKSDSVNVDAALRKPTKSSKVKAAVKKFILGSTVFKKWQRSKSDSTYLCIARSFAENAERHIVNSGGLVGYDAVITTFGPLGDVLLALRLKELYPDVPLIADFRDPMTSSVFSNRIRKRNKSFQERLCACADRIITVSNGYKKKICGSDYEQKASVITNGFDSDDISGIAPVRENEGKMVICCVGYLYHGKRDLTPLFRALAELRDKGEMSLSDVELHYLGGSMAALSEQSRAFGVESILRDFGSVSRRQSLQEQLSADINVLATWNTKGDEGVLPGKTFEYMMVRRPVLSLIGGELAGSEVRRMTEQLGLGFAYEQADPDDAGLCRWLLDMYKAKRSSVQSEYRPNTALVNQYEYSEIASQVDALIRQVIASR